MVREERLSEVWLFGTERIKKEWPWEDAVEHCRHTWPDGRYLDEYVMSVEEAEEMLETGEFPDRVWNEFVAAQLALARDSLTAAREAQDVRHIGGHDERVKNV